MKEKYLSLQTRRKQKELTLTFLSILLGLVSTAILNTNSDTTAQTTSSPEAEKKKDIFKVIMTVQGLDHNSGDIVTIVSINGDSRVKLFDDAKTYIHSVNASDGTGGIVEYVATFPNMTVNVGDEYKVCVLTIEDSNLMCQTGNNSPALRPELIDLFIQEEGSRPTTSQAAMVPDRDRDRDQGEEVEAEGTEGTGTEGTGIEEVGE